MKRRYRITKRLLVRVNHLNPGRFHCRQRFVRRLLPGLTLIGDGIICRLLQPLLLLLGVTLSRAFVRYWLGGIYQSIVGKEDQPRVLIYGAGSAGRQLAAALKTSPELVVVGLLDDDDRLHGHVLNGLAIYSPQDLSGLVVSCRPATNNVSAGTSTPRSANPARVSGSLSRIASRRAETSPV